LLSLLIQAARPAAASVLDVYARLAPEADREVLSRPEFKAVFLDDLLGGSRKQLAAPFCDVIVFRDTIIAIGLPYMASAFGIFLLRQTFKTVPAELDEAARIEGCTPLQVLWEVYVPLARPVYIAYALVSVSYHWNNFLWPLIITNSVESRPLTVGLQVFSATDQGIDWSIITAATLLTTAPLLVAFLLFQRQFVQSFMRAGIK